MGSAVGHLQTLTGAVSTGTPATAVISNKDGEVVRDGQEVLSRIVGQIANPVRWDLCMERMLELEVTGMLELPPAGTLTGIAKRAMKGVETFALKTPDQLDDARAFVERHGGVPAAGATPDHVTVIAPAGGTFHLAPEAAGADDLDPGRPVGEVSNVDDRTSVVAPHGGQVVEWLVKDGDTVSPGQPLLRLQPQGAS
jgi:[acyl-carrier-protein] S-malonyltransferase